MWPLAFIVICLFCSFALHVAHVESHNADVEAEKAKTKPVPVASEGALPGELLESLPAAAPATATNTTPDWTSYPPSGLQHFPQPELVAFNLDSLPSLDDADFHNRFDDHESHELSWSFDYAD